MGHAQQVNQSIERNNKAQEIVPKLHNSCLNDASVDIHFEASTVICNPLSLVGHGTQELRQLLFADARRVFQIVHAAIARMFVSRRAAGTLVVVVVVVVVVVIAVVVVVKVIVVVVVSTLAYILNEF